MYINYLDLFSVKVEGDPGQAHLFVQDEYKRCSGNKPANEVALNLRFSKDRMAANEYIVRNPVSYDGLGAYIFDHEWRKARIDFDSIGYDVCNVYCDPDFHPPFLAILLEFMAYLLSLGHNKAFCHASGFVYQEAAFLCPAWRNVGKTNSLLQFMQDGAEYLADDWCLLDANGSANMIPKRVHMFEYNFLEFPGLAGRVNHMVQPLLDFYSKALQGEYSVPEKSLSEIRQKLRVRVEPEQLFPSSVRYQASGIDYVFLLSKNLRDPERGVYVNPVRLDALIHKLIKILQYEQRPFRLAYSVHKARTGNANRFLEEESRMVSKIFEANLSEACLYEVMTPGQDYTRDVKSAIQEVMGQSRS